MSTEDTEHLCSIFYQLLFDELHALDNQNFPWLQPMKGLTLLPAVEAIRRSLNAFADEQVRLNCTATLYAWLIPRGVYSPWVLYRLDASIAELDTTAVGLIASRMTQSTCSNAGYGYIDVHTARLFTILRQDKFYSPTRYWPVCLCIWRGLPYLALHTPALTLPRAVDSPALASVIGDLEKCLQGIYSDLNSAHVVATRAAKFE